MNTRRKADFAGVRNPVLFAEGTEELFEGENVIDTQNCQAFFTENYFILDDRSADNV